MPAAIPYSDPSLHLFGRDVQSTLTPNATQRTTLIVAGCYVIAIAILWYVHMCGSAIELQNDTILTLQACTLPQCYQ